MTIQSEKQSNCCVSLRDRVGKLSALNSFTIDVIRIFAAWCVLLGHCFERFELTIFRNEEKFFYIQNMAVIIFFTLAGFLMVYAIEKRAEAITWKDYIAHQAVRIYKIYLPALLCIALIDWLHILLYNDAYLYYSTYNIRTFIGNVFMLQNLNVVEGLGRFGSVRPLWTMAVEWWYYVVFSYLFIKVYKEKRRDIKTIIAVVVLGVFFTKYLYSGLAVSFCLGMLVYFVLGRFKSIRHYWYGALSIIAASMIIVCGIVFKQAYMFPIFILIPAFLWSILEFGNRINCDIKIGNILRQYARSTFALYLLHYPIMELISNINIHPVIKLFGVVIISNIVAVLFTFLFDRNIKIRSRKK